MSIFTNQQQDQRAPSGGKMVTTSAAPTTASGHMFLYGIATSTPQIMGFNATPASGSNIPAGRITLANNSAWYFKGQIVCAKTDLSNFTDAAGGPVAFDVAFLVARGANAASTVVIGTPTITKVFGSNNTGVTASNVTITADTTNGNVDINVAGESAISYTFSAYLTYARMGDY